MKLEDILMVKEYLNMFPNNLLGLPLNRDIEFTVDLILGITLTSMAPYRMALLELRELTV